MPTNSHLTENRNLIKYFVPLYGLYRAKKDIDEEKVLFDKPVVSYLLAGWQIIWIGAIGVSAVCCLEKILDKVN